MGSHLFSDRGIAAIIMTVTIFRNSSPWNFSGGLFLFKGLLPFRQCVTRRLRQFAGIALAVAGTYPNHKDFRAFACSGTKLY
jgi:hypothetical protein